MFIAKAFITLAATVTLIQASLVNETNPSVTEICSVAPGQTILRPNSCTHWVKCPSSAESNDYEEGACVYGLHFNKETGRCEYSEDHVCPFEENTVENRCSNNDNVAFMTDFDSDDCRGYVYCKNGKEQKSKCPNDLVFDPSKSSCVYEQDYACPKNALKTETSAVCRSIPKNNLFADDEDCTKYHECTDEGLLTHDCGLDAAFNYVIGRCVNKEDAVCHPTAKKPSPISKICGTDDKPIVGYLSDYETCSGYFICSKQTDNKADRHPTHLQCSAGYFFDPELLSCRDRLNVRCPYDRCENMGNKYVNVLGDCTAYARCSDGVTVQSGHCPKNYFFDERTQGCTPQIVSYAACSMPVSGIQE